MITRPSACSLVSRCSSGRDVHGLTRPDHDLLAVHDAGGDAVDHHPVLGAVLVGLVRQPLVDQPTWGSPRRPCNAGASSRTVLWQSARPSHRASSCGRRSLSRRENLLDGVRRTAATSTAADDVVDPYGRGPEAAHTAALQLDGLLCQILSALTAAARWRMDGQAVIFVWRRFVRLPSSGA
jgi:hypothetical protein